MDFKRCYTLTSIRVLALVKYGPLGASSRMRALQYLPWLENKGLHVTVQSLMDDDSLRSRYQRGGYAIAHLLSSYAQRVKAMLGRASFDVLLIEKEALPWWPLWAELALLRGVPFILDYDDAIFHNYDLHRLPWVQHVYGRRLDGLMAHASLVIGGNEYLAQRARDAGAPWVEVIPTVIDLARYPIKSAGTNEVLDSLPRIVWIGSPSTVHYLQTIAESLQVLAKRVPFILRVIGGGEIHFPGVITEVVTWTEATEVTSIQAGQVGIMPLEDTPWERGKCGYKLIQYMACGLPVVASAVGANNDIVIPDQTGLLARNTDDWIAGLELLLKDASLRQRMGDAGRARVEELYCIQKTAPQLVNLLIDVVDGR